MSGFLVFGSSRLERQGQYHVGVRDGSALPAAAVTTNLGRGTSADDVHELQEPPVHSSVGCQHAGLAAAGGLGPSTCSGEAGASWAESVVASGGEQRRLGARGGYCNTDPCVQGTKG